MKNKKIINIVIITLLIIIFSISTVNATTTKKNNINSTKNNSTTSNKNSTSNETVTNTQNVLDNPVVDDQSEIDSLVYSLSQNGLTKSNLSEAIKEYKKLSQNHTNDEIADMVESSTNNIDIANSDNINNINTILRNFDAEQLNNILDQVDVDEALNELSSGATLMDVVKKSTEDMSPKDKANLAWSVLWSGRIFHIIIICAIFLAIYMILIRCVIYKKANKHAWASFIPIYRDIVMLKICGMSVWWLLLLLVPIIGWVILWVVGVASKFMLAEAFGRKETYGLGLWLLAPIFESILAFSKKCKYIGIEK